MMKNELGGKIMRKFIALRAKMCAYRKLDYLAAQHEHTKQKISIIKAEKVCICRKPYF